ARVLAQPIAGRKFRSRAQIPVADQKESAALTSRRQMSFAVAQYYQSRVRRLSPDLAEGLLADVSAVVVPAELVVVHVADRINRCDITTRAIARAAEQQHQRGCVSRGIASLQRE